MTEAQAAVCQGFNMRGLIEITLGPGHGWMHLSRSAIPSLVVRQDENDVGTKRFFGVRGGGRKPMAQSYGSEAEDGQKGLPSTKGFGESGVVEFACGVHAAVE